MVLERDLKKILGNLGVIYARDCVVCLADWDTLRKQYESGQFVPGSEFGDSTRGNQHLDNLVGSFTNNPNGH